MNEDSFIASDPVFAVADGMGGHEAGEIASGICVRTLAGIPQLASGERDATAGVVQEYLLMADEGIREATGSRAGTTLSGVVVVEQMGVPYWLVLNIGDSRTYRLSQGKLSQVSVDHSEVQELVDAGADHPGAGRGAPPPARRHPRPGHRRRDEADYWLLPIEEGDRILVCSDGLNGELDDEHISNILRSRADPQAAVDELIQAALRSGGRDNVTVHRAWTPPTCQRLRRRRPDRTAQRRRGGGRGHPAADRCPGPRPRRGTGLRGRAGCRSAGS